MLKLPIVIPHAALYVKSIPMLIVHSAGGKNCKLEPSAYHVIVIRPIPSIHHNATATAGGMCVPLMVQIKIIVIDNKRAHEQGAQSLQTMVELLQ